MDNFSWSMSFSAKSGVSASDSGTMTIEGVFSTQMELPADQANPQELDLQLDDVSKIDVLVLTSSIYDEKVEITGSGDTFKLRGPLMLFGDSIAKFSNSLDTLSVQNKHATENAKLQILIGRTLS